MDVLVLSQVTTLWRRLVSSADAQGGFARVWEVQDYKRRSKAVKVVYKPNIKSKKNKTKVSFRILLFL